MKKNICIHGHFYQPPRENPWTGEVDAEESAKPFHDWNERIAKECYAANATAPILNQKGETTERINNFTKISHDIGPTLLSWMKRKEPDLYHAIIESDRTSALRRNGHGNAMAQIYNHIIMPLAKKRDKITQVVWGIRDFEHHYKRKPEGMWLSETAVDKETLGILADNGILYTVLAPHQAHRARHVGFGSHWFYIRNEGIDCRQPYRILLSQGRQFHIFFYDAPVSRGVAFQGLLNNGDDFARKLMGAFSQRDKEQLVSIATDGESYGHHHKFGEMALAYALKKIEDGKQTRLTNYGEYLDRVGSTWEVDIYENSSWSCSHGVERWRSDCGCRITIQVGSNQKWRAYLREAFDFLQEIIDEVFEAQGGELLKDPWAARNDYIDVILDASDKSKKAFMARHARKTLSAEEEKKAWDLLEAEKFSLFMYTSCGWFFDDISGIEPVQVMKFAARAIDLVQPHYKREIERLFLKILGEAKSNIAEQGTGADVYRNHVKPLQNTVHSNSGV